MKEKAFDLEDRLISFAGSAELIKPPTILDPLIRETDELISIFVASVRTSTKKRS